MIHVDCKAYASEILDQVRDMPNKNRRLMIISVGENVASQSYIRGKIKDCNDCGVPYEHVQLSETGGIGGILEYTIMNANNDDTVGGILLQLPLPESDSVLTQYFTNMIARDKDVDGFRDDSSYEPCTPTAVTHVIKRELGSNLAGKRALVIGRGELVGIPVAARLLMEDCTVTIAHSKTTNLNELLAENDIIVSAAGKPNLVDLLVCRNAEIVVDVGVNRNSEGKLCGDCWHFFEHQLPNLKVTPVPGGIGLMTRAMLMRNMGTANE